jgi:hypothetical protein
MINIDDLYLVHYCHPNCTPFMNICRLPEDEAYSLAYAMAAGNPETTAFGRFADFENYYPRRMIVDQTLHGMFTSLGGKPKERHPLFFVLQGSNFLDDWFGNGAAVKIPLKEIPSEYISFTLGDSSSTIRRGMELKMLSKEQLRSVLMEYSGSINDYMTEIAEKYTYIEAQLWNDDYCKCKI